MQASGCGCSCFASAGLITFDSVFGVQAPGLRSSFLGSAPLLPARKPARPQLACRGLPAICEGSKFLLHNLSPQPGSQHRRKRVGRGISAGQVCS